MKMSERSRQLLAACIVIMVMFIAAGAVLTFMGYGDGDASSEEPTISTETQQPQEKADPTPALIGGGAAIVLYFVVSTVVDTVKLRRKRKKAQQNDAAKGDSAS